MALSKVKTMVLVIFFNSCVNAKPLESSIDVREKMIEPLVTCFIDHLKPVITTSDFAGVISKVSRDSLQISTILFGENLKSNDGQHMMSQWGTFVFAPNSSKSLVTMLQAVKSSSWWHIDAIFYIIGNSQDECTLAAEILLETWKMNLLSTFYLCYSENGNILLYTYNPYTNRAPRPWVQANNIGAPDNRWTLYVRQFVGGRQDCANINFDKTRFLDGYKIKSVANTKPGDKWVKDKTYSFESLKKKFLASATMGLLGNSFEAMNVTVIVNYDNPGYFHYGEPRGFLVKLINGSYDVALNGRPQAHNVSSTTPFLQGAARILTRQRNFLSPEEKIYALYSVEIWYLTAIVLFITFVFILVILEKRLFASAAFDLLRLLLGTGVFVPLDRTASRIFFFCVFQLFIILNAMFQGNISTFLTKPERIYIDDVNGLQAYQYQTYIPTLIQNFLDDTTEIPNLKYIPGVDCTPYVINDSSAACISLIDWFIIPAVKYNLHISKSTLPAAYGSFWCREDWPLKQKFELHISRSIETGMYKHYATYSADIPLQRIYSKEEEETAARYRPIELADLGFAFRFFAVGIGISIFGFIIEMIPWRKCSRILKKFKTKRGMSSIARRTK